MTSVESEDSKRGLPRFVYTVVIPVALAIGLAGVVLVLVAPEADDALCPADADCVVAHTDTGNHLFTVEWAIQPDERACGLMFREEMADDHGMVFDFLIERAVSFWMRNTLISLDMIFVEANGTVLNVARGTTPLSEAGVPSDGPVRYVFEVVAGTASRIGLDPGDTIDLDRAPDRTQGTAICQTPN